MMIDTIIALSCIVDDALKAMRHEDDSDYVAEDHLAEVEDIALMAIRKHNSKLPLFTRSTTEPRYGVNSLLL